MTGEMGGDLPCDPPCCTMGSVTSRPTLIGARYSRRAEDLARIQDEPADTTVAAFVRDADGLLISRLTEDDFYTLLLYARREAARALREGHLGRARTAISALTLVDRDRIDPRDLQVGFPLYAVRELGGDVQAEIDAAVARSTPGTAEAFAAARKRADRITLTNCLLAQITTHHGVGFMERWSGGADLRPGLALAAVSLADLIDDEGTYRTGSFRVSDDLPGVWFGRPAGDRVWTRGCVSFNGNHVRATDPYSHGLLVFLAELDSRRAAARLVDDAAAASTAHKPRVGTALGSRFALFIGGSWIADEEPLESDDSLTRFTRLSARLAD